MKPIKTNAQYESALKRIAQTRRNDTAEDKIERFKLAVEIEKYEQQFIDPKDQPRIQPDQTGE